MSNCLTQACSAALLAITMMTTSATAASAEGAKPAVSTAGTITTRSAFGVDETVARLKKDIAAKGITFFQEIDQAELAGKAGIALYPSVLLIFGNPPLGTQFIAANPQAGLDWPVRMLVYRDAEGAVWVSHTDFGWIAKRHGITSRDTQFQMASEVAASIAASVSRR